MHAELGIQAGRAGMESEERALGEPRDITSGA